MLYFCLTINLIVVLLLKLRVEGRNICLVNFTLFHRQCSSFWFWLDTIQGIYLNCRRLFRFFYQCCVVDWKGTMIVKRSRGKKKKNPNASMAFCGNWYGCLLVFCNLITMDLSKSNMDLVFEKRWKFRSRAQRLLLSPTLVLCRAAC